MGFESNKLFKRFHGTKHKYKTNILLFILMAVSIIGLILSVLSFRGAVKRIHMEHLRGTTQRSAQYRLLHANTLLNDFVSDLEMAATLIADYDDLTDPEILKILQASNKTSKFGFISVADPKGNAYDDQGHKTNISERNYFKTAMSGNIGFSEVMESKIVSGKMIQIIAHPIRGKNNTVKGVVYGVLRLNDVEALGLQDEFKLDDSIYIVDSCGEYIGQFRENQSITSKENFWEDMKNTSLTEEEIAQLQDDFAAKRGGGVFYTYGESNRYACYMPIGPNKWQLVYSVSTSSVDDIIHSLYHLDNREGLFAGICYIILMIAVVWHFKRSDQEVRKAHQDETRMLGYMRMALEHSKHIVFAYDQKEKTIRLKTSFQNRLFDQKTIFEVPDSILAKGLIHPESEANFEELFATIQKEERCEKEIQVFADGQDVWYRIAMNNIYNDQNEWIDTVGIVEDISVDKHHEAEAKKRFQLQKTLIANALEYGVVDLNTDTIVEWNEEPRDIPYQKAVTQEIYKVVAEEYLSYVEKAMSLENLRNEYQKGTESIEVQYQQKYNGKLRWVSIMIYRIFEDDGAKVMYVITDIDRQKRQELHLKEQAERDGLTGLYNAITTRTKINEVLSSQYGRKENQVFVLIDLDNFKQINDTFGHIYGDKVLVEVAGILNNRFRSRDVIGRVGGDEFVLLLRDVRSIDFAEQLVANLNTLLHRTYQKGDRFITISASIGLAVAPQDGRSFQELYQKADQVQYQVKRNGKNGFKRFISEG